MKETEAAVGLDAIETGPSGHLQPRLSKLTMVGMSFAILK